MGILGGVEIGLTRGKNACFVYKNKNLALLQDSYWIKTAD
jgi:hypothetical protein